MPDTRITISRNRWTGRNDFSDDRDSVSATLSWDAGVDEMAEQLAGLMVALGYSQRSVASAFAGAGSSMLGGGGED